VGLRNRQRARPVSIDVVNHFNKFDKITYPEWKDEIERRKQRQKQQRGAWIDYETDR
jgi:hypothetical protein